MAYCRKLGESLRCACHAFFSEVQAFMERRPYVCPEEVVQPASAWIVAPFLLLVSLGVFLEVYLHIPYAGIITGAVVIVFALALGYVYKRRKLASFACPNCGATSMEQAEDDENVLLICHACQITWVTNLTITEQESEYTDR